MYCNKKFKLRSHKTSYCLVGVDTKAGLTVYVKMVLKKCLPTPSFQNKKKITVPTPILAF